MAVTAVNTASVLGKESAGAALGAVLAEALNGSILLDLVELKNAHLDLLVLVLELLGLGVGLFL
eukprot:CAMPEP_0175044832 /NCGR_PEP_ID=MMETSP0052_2-20121109/4049_1 /TAXON_ID=51329 ORGANISM="Polytomella parva, Strain SAG 63-3" /NCGR_SAMPLE_ID=MMETSP0052_2 /ASSEMBLY_ACC=CAM_ASM_000194 /LENGTH=63 /DNA_ID=CAMNT_0016308221 /DNA_START=152 /DNA_END=340 /DNA_ORIENTATION=-